MENGVIDFLRCEASECVDEDNDYCNLMHKFQIIAYLLGYYIVLCIAYYACFDFYIFLTKYDMISLDKELGAELLFLP